MSCQTDTLQLIRTKLNRSRISGDLVTRSRLMEKLDRHRDHSLTLVVAPMPWPQTGRNWPYINNNQLAHFLVRVRGVASESYCDIPGNMTIAEESDAGQQHATALITEYQDQAGLMGALDFLCDRRLPLLLVEYVPKEIPEALED